MIKLVIITLINCSMTYQVVDFGYDRVGCEEMVRQIKVKYDQTAICTDDPNFKESL